MFEKYDGVRAFWHPAERTFYSRYGKPFVLPPQITEAMPPNIVLDGELWCVDFSYSLKRGVLIPRARRFGRENFQEAMKLAHRSDITTVDWTSFKYMIFDAPEIGSAYQDRYTRLGTHVALVQILLIISSEKHLSMWPCEHIQLAPRERCRGTEHLEEYFQDIIDRGGEGIILRDPTAPFQAGRCPGYLKHKVIATALS